ncbi:hypothetical protein [Streptomyces sp. CC210A]|uniref:hypothetical protein n=1 Tax=Streptomyces sp. CC210A TaxID=2898184 RepID=UPI001F3F652A|nr:hypothetical protein [Streptomyces sp. CC210A]
MHRLPVRGLLERRLPGCLPPVRGRDVRGLPVGVPAVRVLPGFRLSVGRRQGVDRVVEPRVPVRCVVVPVLREAVVAAVVVRHGHHCGARR